MLDCDNYAMLCKTVYILDRNINSRLRIQFVASMTTRAYISVVDRGRGVPGSIGVARFGGRPR
ncbi:hypothetical protein BDP27DRAFT_1318579 [Rhodocollybia butyracea]|uniref:Uncharacterized protein n=1 Tax=Rhodocollybia butyracea TaxID=206335 RepID=A0A9P5Q3X6_9AGAR|nr:hypothetical protein BDP27DRAFT_1318579 [Rhodocollybia butyracea]